MHEYQAIIRRLQAGESIRKIASSSLFGRHKISAVKKEANRQGWLSANISPSEDQLHAVFGTTYPMQISKAAGYKDDIIGWSKEGITGKAIFNHLVESYAYTGSYANLQRCIRQWRDEITPETMTVPLTFSIGEAAQIDFGKGPDLYDARVGKVVSTWFFVMTLCWSRHQYVELVTHQDVETWLTCHQNAFQWFGGVPSKVIIDNPKCAITKACYYEPEVQRSYEEFSQGYGFIISACPPREPKKKGRVESGIKYVKKNFLPFREFTDLSDANRQAKTWVMETAGQRLHGSTFEPPLTRFEQERGKLKPLPTTLPDIAIWVKVNLYRDCHVRYERCKYSAPYTLYKQPLWLRISANCLTIYHEHQVVAQHARLFKAGAASSKLEHLPPKAQFYLKRDSEWCGSESKKVGPHCQYVIESLLTDPVNDFLRQAQSILALHSTYGFTRLEQACEQAIALSAIGYRCIKTLLKEGRERAATNDPSNTTLSAVYKGAAYYQRHTTEIL